MSPFVDTLATLLETFPIAMVTIVTDDGLPRTRPMKTLPGRFNGHLWLRAEHQDAVDEIGRGADISVAFGSVDAGQYVTIYGWAIVLSEPRYSSKSVAKTSPRLDNQSSRPLNCVTARAAEMWDIAAAASPRVFAFPHTHPSVVDDAAALPALRRRGSHLRVATSEASV